MAEPYAFPKWLVAITPFVYEPKHGIPDKFVIDYLDLWLPRARALLPFGVAREFIHKRCARFPITFVTNHDVPPTYLCELPHQLRQIISRMIIHKLPDSHAECACSIRTPQRMLKCTNAACENACICSRNPRCGLHAEYQSDTVRFTGPGYYSSCLADGILVPYTTPRKYFGKTYHWKLHNTNVCAIMSPDAPENADMQERCPGCGADREYNYHGYFEYGREHKLGNVTMGDYYLFGELIEIPGYISPLCTAEADYYGDVSMDIRSRGPNQDDPSVVYRGDRINFSDGWAQYLNMIGTKGAMTYTIETLSATINHVTGTLSYRLYVSSKHIADKSHNKSIIILTIDRDNNATYTAAGDGALFEFRENCQCDPLDLLRPL